MGFQAQEIIPHMTAIGDAVAALGGRSFEIDRVAPAAAPPPPPRTSTDQPATS